MAVTNREQLRLQAFTEIAKLLAEGNEKGLKKLREKYHGVPIASWYRWIHSCKELVGHVDQKTQRLTESAAIALEIGEHLPAAPSPDYVGRPRASGNMDFMQRLEDLYADAETLRQFSMDTKTGRIKLPKYLTQSVSLRQKLLETALKAMQEVWDLRRMQSFYDSVLAEISQESPEVAMRIMERLKKLNSEIGMTFEARL
jgi:hypothetical protein